MASRRRRRANGEGSVCRRADGRWVATITVGRDENGRLRRRAVYGRTQGEALEKLRQLQAGPLGGTPVADGRTRLADYLGRWLEESARPSIARSTYRGYRGYVANHIVPVLGQVRLARLTPQHVQSLRAELERRGASPHARLMATSFSAGRSPSRFASARSRGTRATECPGRGSSGGSAPGSTRSRPGGSSGRRGGTGSRSSPCSP